MSSNYDFNKREDYDYSFSYDYLGGVGLGKSEVEAERLRKSKLGTYDMKPIDPPNSDLDRDEVIKIANMIHSSSQRESLVSKIMETKDRRLEFVWNNNHEHHLYFEWALHCIDRQVENWQKIRKESKLADPPVRVAVSSETQRELKIGDTVEISNIKSRPELNGKYGKIVSVTPSDRYMVEFMDINQTVSIAQVNCELVGANAATEQPSWKGNFPRGLKVVIRGLTSDQGKLLNGLHGTVVDYKSERYLVRLDDSYADDLKSIKEHNLHVPPPTGWEEKMDESSGKTFYVNSKDGDVSWEHPILSRSRKRTITKPNEFVKLDREEPVSDTEAPIETESSFNREEFLREEAKRLKLERRDKKAAKHTDIADTIAEKLKGLRNLLGLSDELIFSGTPRELLGEIRTIDGDAKSKLLFTGLCMILEDYKKLKFNKNQLIGLGDKIDDVVENGGSFPDHIIAWIEGGLQLAIPIRYSF